MIIYFLKAFIYEKVKQKRRSSGERRRDVLLAKKVVLRHQIVTREMHAQGFPVVAMQFLLGIKCTSDIGCGQGQKCVDSGYGYKWCSD